MLYSLKLYSPFTKKFYHFHLFLLARNSAMKILVTSGGVSEAIDVHITAHWSHLGKIITEKPCLLQGMVV